jgi:hypothetical protein
MPRGSISVRILLIALFGCAARSTEPAVKNAVPARAHPPMSLVGRWRVIGCETSPLDPADCGRGQIVFTTDRVTIDVPAADHTAHVYRLVSSSADHVAVNIDGETSDITLDANGEAQWGAPGFDGRVGRLRFVRAP